MLQLVWLLPVLNIVTAFCVWFFAKKASNGKAHIWTLTAITVSLIIAVGASVQALSVSGPARLLAYARASWSYEWFDFGAGSLRLGVHVDGFALTMLLVVCVISMMMQIYSISYMRGEIRYITYYATVSLFGAGMMVLVLAPNMVLAIFGWEIMGFCSYQLIGHYHETPANAFAAMKAFLTTRTGDIGLITGTITVFWACNTFDIARINILALEGRFAGPILTIAAILLFIGVIGKSAQFPLHTWLPDAMAGPTPASSLIHAATMVVAGVYLVARLFPMYVEAFGIGTADGGVDGYHLVAVVGAITAIVAALIALVQWDLKKVLAYSTISQLGFMVFGLGVGAWGAAVFHIVTHAGFKALLFLGSGSVIHSVHTQDMREMGGLKKHMPTTYWTWIIGTLALSGIFPFAGFFSKDEILSGAFNNGANHPYLGIWIIGMTVAFLTAFYMFRATHLTFHGEFRGHGHPHESDNLITSPLIILAAVTSVIGFLGLPGPINLFDRFAEPFVVKLTLEKYAAGLEHATSWSTVGLLAGLSLGAAGLGILLSSMLFLPAWRERFAALHNGATEKAPLKPIRVFLENKLYLDKLYGGLTLWIRDPLSKAAYWFNQNAIDQVLNLAGKGSVELGKASYVVDRKVIDAGITSLADGSRESGKLLRTLQTGKVQQYAGVLFAAAALIGIVLVLVK